MDDILTHPAVDVWYDRPQEMVSFFAAYALLTTTRAVDPRRMTEDQRQIATTVKAFIETADCRWWDFLEADRCFYGPDDLPDTQTYNRDYRVGQLE